jgi:hypothetical protein
MRNEVNKTIKFAVMMEIMHRNGPVNSWLVVVNSGFFTMSYRLKHTKESIRYKFFIELLVRGS